MKVLTFFLILRGKIGAELDYDKTVIATGGSMVLSENAMENLRKNGKVVFIDVGLDENQAQSYKYQNKRHCIR